MTTMFPFFSFSFLFFLHSFIHSFFCSQINQPSYERQRCCVDSCKARGPCTVPHRPFGGDDDDMPGRYIRWCWYCWIVAAPGDTNVTVTVTVTVTVGFTLISNVQATGIASR